MEGDFRSDVHVQGHQPLAFVIAPSIPFRTRTLRTRTSAHDPARALLRTTLTRTAAPIPDPNGQPKARGGTTLPPADSKGASAAEGGGGDAKDSASKSGKTKRKVGSGGSGGGSASGGSGGGGGGGGGSGAAAGADPNQTISYNAERIIGNGSFGVVFQATVEGTNEVVAIKKVLQDKRFKNRELQIMRQLVKAGRHPNIVHLQHCFYSR